MGICGKKVVGPAPTPPDGGWGWVCVFAGTVVMTINGGLAVATSLLYLTMLEKFQASAAVTAGAVGLDNGLSFLIGPVATELGQRFGYRRTVILAGALLGIGFIGAAFATHIAHVYVCYAIAGIGSGIASMNTLLCISGYFERKRSLVLALSNMGFGIGIFLYPFLIKTTLEEYGYFGTCLILGGVNLNVCLCGALYRPIQQRRARTASCADERDCEGADRECEIPLKEMDQPDNTNNHSKNSSLSQRHQAAQRAGDPESSPLHQAPEAAVKKSPCEDSMFLLFKDFTFITFLIACVGFILCFFMVISFLPALSKERGISSTQIALILTVSGVAELAAMIPCGSFLVIKSVKSRIRHVYSAYLVLYGLAVTSLYFADKLHWIMLLSILQASVKGSIFGQMPALLADLFGFNKMAKAYGLINGAIGVAALLWPTIAGGFHDRLGTYGVPFAISGAIALATAIILESLFLLKEKNRKSPETKQENDVEHS